MRHSDSIVNIVKALSEAQKAIEPPKKDTAGQVGNKPYKYADLAACRAAYRTPLADQGIFVVHSLTPVDGHIVLTTTLQHTSAEWLASDVPIPATLKPQDFGSALTYYRRYNVSAMLDLAAEDDDGKAAQDAAGKPAEKAPAPPKPTPEPTVKASVISREEIEALHSLAKTKGLSTVTEFRAYLKNLTSQEQAKDLSRAEYVSVLDALKAMREKVPA